LWNKQEYGLMIKVDENRANSAGVIPLFQEIEARTLISNEEFNGLRSPRAIRHPHVSRKVDLLR